MVLATNLGFPRIGAHRELKKATESYWRGDIDAAELQKTGADLRKRHWQMQKEAGIDHIPSNDFSFYDQVLDMACLLGCIPPRYDMKGGMVDLDTYFTMARGDDSRTAMEMTKWFDTNYHYIVPEFYKDQEFKITSTKIFDEFAEALEEGITTRPVLIGPLTFIALGKEKEEEISKKDLLHGLLPVYAEIINRLQKAGAEWIQIDEPFLALDFCEGMAESYKIAYEYLAEKTAGSKILLATYFESLHANAEMAFTLPVHGFHLDMCRTTEDEIDKILAQFPLMTDMVLSLGVVDGRNIWRNDLAASLETIGVAAAQLGTDRVMVGPGCSLLHSPNDLDLETELEPEIRNWMAFAKQKLAEIAAIAKGTDYGHDTVADLIAESDKAQENRKNSARIHNPGVQERMAGITEDMTKRKNPFPERQKARHKAVMLPSYPVTTIGSFPQTPDIRKARAAYKKGTLGRDEYVKAMQDEIRRVVEYQEETGLDVFVHGEPERNDMVEYFGEKLDGFAFTKNGWVQSYGSRCVKPPVIFGDVSRPAAMTVEWSKFAQSLTEKPMKGMLTGPITIMCWSFVRDDQPREKTCRQIALALRDEVADLEKAGITTIQMDEPAIREGLPLRREDWESYLGWAVDCFKLSVCTVEDSTQIHTHMCYSEFNDIIASIGALDADVISVEASRSQMELLDAFVAYDYPNEIGPGVYDIHSPRIPSAEEMADLLEKAEKVLKSNQLWVNPDCGLKTRRWEEVAPALKNMVEAAQIMRQKRKRKAA